MPFTSLDLLFRCHSFNFANFWYKKIGEKDLNFFAYRKGKKKKQIKKELTSLGSSYIFFFNVRLCEKIIRENMDSRRNLIRIWRLIMTDFLYISLFLLVLPYNSPTISYLLTFSQHIEKGFWSCGEGKALLGPK